jgi:hypothetical protein
MENQQQEEWRTLEGYPGYSFSNTGKAYSYKSNRYIGGSNSKRYTSVHLVKENKNNKNFNLSRIIYQLFGENPEMLNEKEVDHINRDSTDNNINNLRLSTRTENEANKGKYSTYGKKPCSSMFVGVYWQKQKQKWRVSISIGNNFHLGYYKQEHNAGYVYNQVASSFKPPNHWLNSLGNDFELPQQEENREYKISQAIAKINHYLNENK